MEFVSYDIASDDFRHAGAASRSIKEHLKRIGADSDAIRRTMIAAYEAEMNVVIHSVGGRLEACLSDSQIDVNVIDDGPGIPDVEQAMVEGYSTASAEARALGFGAGMGLPNIKRNSDRLRITSRVDEGTRVSFTVYLRPEATCAARIASLYASADKCRDCRACLTACPTQAMRVRNGRPRVLEHLCVECAECIRSCATEALSIRDEYTSLDDLKGRERMLLVVPPGLLAGCGAEYRPAQVLAALRGLGFADVITSAPFEEALRHAAGLTVSPEEAQPVIVPSCPAIVNLIELRFPSLVPYLAEFDSPIEAVQAAYGDRPVAYVVSCPSQRSALLAHAQTEGDGGERRSGETAEAEYLPPGLVRQAVMVRLTGGDRGDAGTQAAATAVGRDGAGAAHAAAGDGGTGVNGKPLWMNNSRLSAIEGDGVLTVTGIDHVIAVLENIEDGLLDDINASEPYACEGGCFGSPLLAEDYHVASRRWRQGRAAVDTVPGTAVARRRAFAARPGIRLDSDMAKAIEKLSRMQELIRALPGRDCGACGAPTCAALAEDIVMERAQVELCPYVTVTDKEVVER
jgi:anti-sigma regulatory factor (Ser/Thr protein kinase)/Na+-translocating ferredoxin:NAD+ oxidoreductase RNF subunit RnfB